MVTLDAFWLLRKMQGNNGCMEIINMLFIEGTPKSKTWSPMLLCGYALRFCEEQYLYFGTCRYPP